MPRRLCSTTTYRNAYGLGFRDINRLSAALEVLSNYEEAINAALGKVLGTTLRKDHGNVCKALHALVDAPRVDGAQNPQTVCQSGEGARVSRPKG